MLSYIPGVYRLFSRGIRETHTPLYCYEVWFKHFLYARQAGLPGVPRAVAELGPGDSLGVGLTALLCGAESFRALDVRRYGGLEKNLALLDGLVELLRTRTRVPTSGWPPLESFLNAEGFPAGALDSAALSTSLAPERVEAIRAAVAQAFHQGEATADGIRVGYDVPWDVPGVLADESGV